MIWANSIPVAKLGSRRTLSVVGLGLGLLFAVGSWVALRSLPWFGPLVADGLRGLLGSERVTRLEELEANAEDRVAQATQPSTLRSLQDSTPDELLSMTKVAPSEARPPANVAPLFAQAASAEDGVWQSVRVRVGEPSLYRTLLHPDPERKYAELFVFSLDLARVRLHAVAGSIEPSSPTNTAQVARPGLIPLTERPHLIAAFNGGFKAEHGQFGMMVDGAELLAPKPGSCTVAGLADGQLRIAPWTTLAPEAARLSWWRQTPGCMVLNGALSDGLRAGDTRDWGATLQGKTVIRRSAIGLSEDGRRLLVGISNYTTARAIALGMQRAGALTVAQLDVNFSYPRFVLYSESASSPGELHAVGAVKGFLSEPGEYLGRASTRDFFYVTAL